MADDQTLALAAARGDRRALEELLARHVDRVHAVCRRVLANPEDALDATQEALIAISKRIDSFDGRSAFTTWLYRVATNAALDEGRRKSRRPTPVEVLPESGGVADGGSDTPGFDDAVVTRLAVDEALSDLPDDYRVAVTLRDVAGLEYSEIAEITDAPIGTVRSRISRGRTAVAEALSGNSKPPGERLRNEP